jgi:hypothetical protein
MLSAVMMQAERQPAALLHHGALDLIALAELERDRYEPHGRLADDLAQASGSSRRATRTASSVVTTTTSSTAKLSVRTAEYALCRLARIHHCRATPTQPNAYMQR